MALRDNLLFYFPGSITTFPYTDPVSGFTIDKTGSVTYTGTSPGPAVLLGGTASDYLKTDGSVSPATPPPPNAPAVAPLTLGGFFRMTSNQKPASIINLVLDDSNYFDVAVDGSFFIETRARNGGTSGIATKDPSLTFNTWYLAAGVFTSSTSRQSFSDTNGAGTGTLGTADTTSVTPAGAARNFGFGALRRTTVNQPFIGYVRDLFAFSRALSQAELQSISANPSLLLAADTTAPVLTSPVGTQTGSTTATIGATTDEGNGTMYGVVTVSSTVPSVAQIKAGQDNSSVTAAFAGNVTVSSTGAKTISATGLSASTAYYAHIVHTDAATNDSNRVSSAQFTTAAGGDVTPPTLTSPTGSSTGSTTGSGGVTTNEANGTLYAVCTLSATAPTGTQVKAGQSNLGTAAPYASNQSISSTGAKSFSATGLTAGTTYYWHFLHRDAAGNDSTVSSFTTGFTTSSTVGTITTPPIANNTGNVFASETGAYAYVINQSTGAVTVTKSAQTTSASGVMAVADGTIVPGTTYDLAVRLSGGAVGMYRGLVAA